MSSAARAERRREARAAAKTPAVELPTERDGLKLVYQRGDGDCVRACIATLYGCDLDDTPAVDGTDDPVAGLEVGRAWRAWLAERGWALAEGAVVLPLDEPRWIAFVLTGPFREPHAIVCNGTTVIHDPAAAVDPRGGVLRLPYPLDVRKVQASLLVGPAEWVSEREAQMREAERQVIEQHMASIERR